MSATTFADLNALAATSAVGGACTGQLSGKLPTLPGSRARALAPPSLPVPAQSRIPRELIANRSEIR